MLHSLSATAAGVDGTTLIDLGTAARPIVATLGDTTVYSAADNAFIFNSSVGNAISFNNATLGGTFGATLSFWWRHECVPAACAAMPAARAAAVADCFPALCAFFRSPPCSTGTPGCARVRLV